MGGDDGRYVEVRRSRSLYTTDVSTVFTSAARFLVAVAVVVVVDGSESQKGEVAGGSKKLRLDGNGQGQQQSQHNKGLKGNGCDYTRNTRIVCVNECKFDFLARVGKGAEVGGRGGLCCKQEKLSHLLSGSLSMSQSEVCTELR